MKFDINKVPKKCLTCKFADWKNLNQASGQNLTFVAFEVEDE